MDNLLVTTRGIVNIRPAAPDDAASLSELRLEALAGYPEAFAADYTITATEPAEVWSKLIADNVQDNKGIIHVATMEKRLIGMIGLVYGHWPKTRHSGEMWGLYVTDDWRRYHVAETLVKECISWAQTQGLVIIKLSVITSNTPAISCYTSCGFTYYGIEPKLIYYNGVFYDGLLMAKQIS